MLVRDQADSAAQRHVGDAFHRGALNHSATADAVASLPAARSAGRETPMEGSIEATGFDPWVDPFLPSEYTGLLLQAIRHLPDPPADSQAADIGVGSGVLLASLALRGIGRVHGVDSQPAAIRATASLLGRLGLAGRATLSLGNVWETLEGERFDLVVANLPQYPSDRAADPHRIASWSAGGPDGRRVMDPFLAGLGAHLRPGGIALITHSTLIGLARTRAILADQGLGCTALLASQVLLPPHKAALLPPEAWGQPGLLEVGPYRFIEAQVLRIAPL